MSSDFEKRLEKAINRGRRIGSERARRREEEALSAEELKRLHSQHRLELSDHIEKCLSRLPNHFPGFQHESIVGDRGWGAAVSRDDVGPGSGGRRDNFYSRLEMVVRPFSTYAVLELAAKGTVRNKEIYNRKHFQKLTDADLENFLELVDLWTLEYAELYAAKS